MDEILASDLRKGDRIMAYAEPTATLPFPVEVERVIGLIRNGPARPTIHFHAVQPAEWTVTPDRYISADYRLKVERRRSDVPEGYEIRKPRKITAATRKRWNPNWDRYEAAIAKAAKGKEHGWVTLREMYEATDRGINPNGHEASPNTTALERRGIIEVAVRKGRPQLYRLK